MVNKEIREALKDNQIKQWQLANLLGVSEQTIYRRLRNELPDEEKKRIISVIEANRKG